MLPSFETFRKLAGGVVCGPGCIGHDEPGSLQLADGQAPLRACLIIPSIRLASRSG